MILSLFSLPCINSRVVFSREQSVLLKNNWFYMPLGACMLIVYHSSLVISNARPQFKLIMDVYVGRKRYFVTNTPEMSWCEFWMIEFRYGERLYQSTWFYQAYCLVFSTHNSFIGIILGAPDLVINLLCSIHFIFSK